jgi:hypothetical protein
MSLVRTDVSEENAASIFRVEKIRQRRTALAVGLRSGVKAMHCNALPFNEVCVGAGSSRQK